MRSLSKLSTFMTAFSAENSEGVCPPMDRAGILELKKLYRECSAKADKLIKNELKNKNVAAVMPVLRNIRSLIKTDEEVIYNIPENAEISLPNLIEQTRSTYAEINDPNYQTVGDFGSIRIPMEYTDSSGNTIRGFFTREKEYHADADKFLKEAIEEKAAAQGSGAYREFYGLLLELGFGIKELKELQGSPKNMSAFLGGAGWPEPKINKLLSDEAFKQDMEELINTHSAIKKDAFVTGSMGFCEGSRIDSRNTAMSSVADMLGVKTLLAASSSMTVKLSGRRVKGTFMLKATGTDKAHIQENDPLLKWTRNARTDENSFDNARLKCSPSALRDMADMDALDFICGNVDRHDRNFFYHFDTSDPENPVLTGLEGIDNDLSFGTTPVEESQALRDIYLSSPIMTADMAKRVLAMTEEGLTVTLAGKGLKIPR